MRAAFPYSVRRACLRSFSDGEASYGDIEKMFTIKSSTFRGWAKVAGIDRGSKLTDTDLDAKIAEWGERVRDIPLRDEGGDVEVQQWIKDRKNRHKFGETEENKAKALSAYESLADPGDWVAAVDGHFKNAVQQLSNPELSPEMQVNLMTTQLLLVQLKGMIEAPPPVNTWADGERVIKLLRLTLGMDADKGSAERAVDLRVLNSPMNSAPGKRKKG
jgi:hypothetical protein